MPPTHQDTDLPLPRHTVATNLPPVSRQPLKRRQSRLLRRPHKRLRPSSADDNDDDDALFTSAASLSDAAIALQTLHESWPHEARHRLPRTPPIILLNQVHALVPDVDSIDAEVEKVAREEWRKLVLPGGEDALVKLEDLESAASSDVAKWFVREALPKIKVPVVLQTALDRSFDDDVAALLVREGFLTMRDEASFWLAAPGMGEFLRNRAAGKKELLGILRRAPYQEMLIEKLELRTLKKSVFTAQWHVRDVVGGGVAETVATSMGTLVRLREPIR